MGGGGFSMEPDNPALDLYVLAQVRKRTPAVCFLATASGDADGYIEKFYAAFKTHRCRPTQSRCFVKADVKQLLLTERLVVSHNGSPLTKFMLGFTLLFLGTAVYDAFIGTRGTERLIGLLGASATCLVVAIAFHERARFEFSKPTHLVTWRRRWGFRERSGTMPFGAIQSVDGRKAAGRRGDAESANQPENSGWHRNPSDGWLSDGLGRSHLKDRGSNPRPPRAQGGGNALVGSEAPGGCLDARGLGEDDRGHQSTQRGRRHQSDRR